MNRSAKIEGALRFAVARLKNARAPVVVRWQMTNSCQAACEYCKVWQSPSDELTTGEAKRMLLELRRMGMSRLCFSGGEPLMRGDFDDIVDFCDLLGVSMEMNTNGLLVADYAASLKKLEIVKISLDGPEEIHDNIRGVRMFADIMSNARAARDAGIRISFTTTLVRENTEIETVDRILDIAREFDTFVAFQPVVSTTPWGSVELEDVAPDREKFREVVGHLMEVKAGGGSCIRNSMKGLRHVSRWPEFPAIKCTAGVIFAIVESNGDLYACERTPYPRGTRFPNVRGGVRSAFESIVMPDCGGCGFCGALELNFLWNLSLSSWREVLRVVGL